MSGNVVGTNSIAVVSSASYNGFSVRQHCRDLCAHMHFRAKAENFQI